MRALNRLESLVVAFRVHVRAVDRLGENACLNGRVELAADRSVLPGVRFALLLQLGNEVPADPLKGRVAEGIIVVAHAVSLRGLGGVSVLDEGLVEGIIPGFDQLGAERVGGHPVDARRVLGANRAIVGVGVLLAPETVQAGGDVADARVPVVPVAQGRDEVQEHLLDVRVVVVGGERLLLVVVEVVRAARVRATVNEVLGQRRGIARVVNVEADNRLVSARRDGIEHGVDGAEVVGVGAGDDVLEREDRPFERVGQRALCEHGVTAGGGSPRHEALHRVRHRGRRLLERGPLGGGGRRGRGWQGGTRQSCGRRESDGDASNFPHREVLSVCTAAGDGCGVGASRGAYVCDAAVACELGLHGCQVNHFVVTSRKITKNCVGK